MRNTQALRNINNPSLTALGNQVIDDFNVILCQLTCSSLSSPTMLLSAAPSMGRSLARLGRSG
jgi:hypothetical protein